MQQFRYNDIQLLQQHLKLKQQQELQRQQQPPQLCDTRRRSSINLPFAASKQSLGDIPELPLINGTALNDTSRLLTDWDNHGAPPFVQGLQNHLSPSVEQGQAMRLTGLFPHRVGASIYGSPFPGTRDNESHSDQLRGISPETANLANKIIDPQQPLSVLQSSASSTSFVRDQPAVSSEQVCMPEGLYTSVQDYIGESIYGELLPKSHSVGPLLGTLQPDNVMQTSKSLQEFSWKQDQAGWPGDMLQKPAQMIPLDPLEKNILYNSDDSAWDASFGKYSDTVHGGSGNVFEPIDTFPSLHSGSWSALMQSAVAETSNGDTGLTEEWNGSTYENPDSSTENQPPVMDGWKLLTGWAANSFQSPSSLTSSPFPAFHNSGKDPTIPIFQPSSVQSLSNQHDGLHQAVSPETIEKLVTDAIEWLDRYSVQKHLLQGNQQLQLLSHLNAWSAQIDYTKDDKNPLAIPSYDDSRRSPSQEKGENSGVLYHVTNASNALRNANSAYAVDNWSSTGGLDQLQSDASISTLARQNSKMDNFTCIQNSSIESFQQVPHQHVQAQNQPKTMSQAYVPMYDKENASTERNSNQNISASILHYPFKASNEIYPVGNVMDKVTGLEHGHLNASDIDTNLAKESASSGGNLKILEGFVPRIDPQPNKSSPFDGYVGSHGVNITAMRSVAEEEWAQATNQSIEKLEGEVQKIKGKWPKLQARRRLLLSTQLMQQLLRSPPASMLLVDASSTYDSLTYFVAKVTIGNACSPTNIHKSDLCMPSKSSDRIHEKVEAFGRSDDNYFTKAVEDFTSRAKKLEDDLLRLEQAATFLDINVENQELERYSVINRFAKFHTRGQANSSKILPSTGAAPTVPRVSPQRYVTLHPLPETLPEGVKCLSL